MKIEKRILKLIKADKKDLQIDGVRFINKIDEKKWSFRYIFRDGDHLSLSDEHKAEFVGINLVLIKENIFKSPGVFTIERDNTIKKKKNEKQI